MSYILELLELALKNLNRYKLRSFLTTIGIVFGIGAVVSMMSVGAGAKSELLNQIKKMGIQNIIINTVKPPETKKASGSKKAFVNNYGLLFRDVEYCKAVLTLSKNILQVHKARKKVYYQSKVLEPKILGVEPDYFKVLNLEPQVGRFFHAPDYKKYRRVCVIEAGILEELQFYSNPLTLEFAIGNQIFEVIGVVKQEKDLSTQSSLQNQSFTIYIPFSTSIKRFGTFSLIEKTGSSEVSRVELEQIIVSCKKPSNVIPMASVIASIFKKLHRKRDYEIVIPLKQLRQAQKTQNIFRVVMILIAGISLLIGGIGIANITFASVTERTREIGIRRALGAKRKDIMLQFLCETIVIAIVGGILGTALGIVGTYGIQSFTGWEASININSLILTLIVSGVVGILSGMAPAHYAAKLNPVTSLRHE